MRACRFIVVDDHQLFTDGLVRILKEERDFNPVAVFSNANDIWDGMRLHDVDLVLLDIQLRDQSGLDVCRHIRKLYPEVKIVLISMIQAPHILKEGLKQGANGYIPKTIDARLLKEILRRIWHGENVFLAIQDTTEETKQPLTNREMEIIHLIKNGLSTKAIAEQLFLSEYTVETHRKNICRKLEVNSLAELIAYAYANHL